MKIDLGSVYERDMDFLFMRKLASSKDFVRQFFLTGRELAEKGYDKVDFTVDTVAHSVTTEDGESDIEVTLIIENKKVAFLIEDKIDAAAQPEQADRYTTRGRKAVKSGMYDEILSSLSRRKIIFPATLRPRNMQITFPMRTFGTVWKTNMKRRSLIVL